ncbi:inorganic phosphate transporter, partial [Acinetobacter baumannii]
MQLVSASLYSLGHGGNDAQKTMGIIAVLLFSTGRLQGEFHVPLWIVLSCHAAMGLGTLFGGWRIVETMGMKITKLKPIGGFCAETGG